MIDMLRDVPSEPKEHLVSEQWLICQLSKLIARERSGEESLPFRITRYERDASGDFILTMEEETPLIALIRDFSEAVQEMGIADLILMSGIENGQLIAEHEEIYTGHIGDNLDELDDRQRDLMLERQKYLQEAVDDTIVEYVQPSMEYWGTLSVYTEHYRLQRDERAIRIESAEQRIATFEFDPEYLLRAYLLYCLDRQAHSPLQVENNATIATI